MNKLQALFEQLRNLDPNDPGRWPIGVRIATVALLFLVAALGGLLLLRLEEAAPGAARGARQGRRAAWSR